MGIRTDEFGTEFSLVVQCYFDAVHAGHHVGVRQDVAVCADNEAGTEILIFVFIGSLQLRGVGHQALEKVVKRIVFGERAVVGLVGIVFGLFGCLDIDDSRAFLLHKLGKVG